MALKQKQEEPETIGTIIITRSSDPAQPPKVTISGDWLHKHMIAMPGLINKAFRTYIGDIRRQATQSTSEEES